MKIQNPIIRGFYPDPSICKANGKYYIACSSFQYFPGVPILESTDLVNWKHVGNCLTRLDQVELHKVPSSGGVFAPTLRYHNGVFYMVTNNNTFQKNFYISTQDIYGEWSAPVYVDQEGIDPSLLFDGDKVYFTSNGNDVKGNGCILQCEIDIKTGEKLTESIPIWGGNGGRYLESPHLYHIGAWYYLVVAEGGTEYGHMITYARSRSPFGPFESFPGNPVLTNRNLGGHQSLIQGIGHGDLISDEAGNYYIVCLGFRQSGIWMPYHHLGRETFLAQVRWREEGWFEAGDNGTVREWMDIDVFCEKQEKGNTDVSGFDLADPRWCYLRDYNKENYRVDGEVLKLRGTDTSLEELDSPTFVGVRQSEFNTQLRVTVGGDAAETGISFYMDESEHYDLALVRQGERAAVELKLKVGDVQAVKNRIELPNGCNEVVMEVESKPEYYSFYVCQGLKRNLLGTARTKYLSTEVAGGFTGVVMGCYAIDREGKWGEFRDLTWTQKNN